MRGSCSGQRFVWLIQVGLGLMLGWIPFHSAWAQSTGEVVSALGAVEVLREARWQPVNGGATLAAGETVRTGAGSRAAILLASGTQIKLNAHSQIELKRIAPPVGEGWVSTTAQALQNILRLLSGEVWVRNSGEPLEIQTAPATAAIRGTEFTLALGPQDSARLAVINGLVELSNPQGSVLVAANEQADVQAGAAPRKTVLLNPLDAVQWSLYYPDGVGASADRPRRDDPQSSHYWTQAAQQHLLQGQIPAARQALEQALALDARDAVAYSLRSHIALVQNQTAQARSDAERAIAVNPTAPAAWLSLSWVQQAEFDLEGALDSARRAVALDPGHAQALIQESSLLFGMGRLQEAAQVAKRARSMAPDDAMVNTVRGFLQLARNRVDQARTAFEAAIAQDSTLGLPRLGLGLVLFRRNQTEAAIAEMQKATLLEPQVSLYNSYLGKAFYETKQDRRAQKYLEVAKQLDARDPTPWFYDAVRLQSANRPAEAVTGLQKSIDLNEGRGVYRSRLLLDEDLAARDAALGKLYNEVGFEQLGLREGWKSVGHDPANHSAHRLLADSYAAMPGVEAARTSELLQAQLLQPINITPVSPQMAETRLLMPGAGPITPSLYEFNPLFVRNRPSLFFSGLGGNQDTWGDEVIVSGLTDRFAYSFGQFHYQNDGYRPNNDLENNLYNLFVQTAVTPDFSLQAEYRYRETMNGDLASQFDGSFSSFKRKKLTQHTARIGTRYSLSPQTDVIASVIYVDRDNVLRYPNFDLTFRERNQGTQAEAQWIHKADSFNLITGLGGYSYEVIIPDYVNKITANKKIIYSYANIKIPDPVIWTIGLSYESAEEPNANLDEFNPKLGVQWAINDRVSLRAAAFQAVKRTLAFQQSIEPTQVAGFNQLNDDINMTVSKNYGVGLNVRFNDQFFGGLEALRRDIDAPLGVLAQPEFYEIVHNQENIYRAYLYWLPSLHWAVTASWWYEKLEVVEDCALCLFLYPAQLKTVSLPLIIQYFNPSGFFSELSVVYVNQDVQTLEPASSSLLSTQNDFTLVNAGLGYRFPKRWGILAFQANNLFDRKFNFQDSGFQAGDGTANPLYLPERTIIGRLILNF